MIEQCEVYFRIQQLRNVQKTCRKVDFGKKYFLILLRNIQTSKIMRPSKKLLDCKNILTHGFIFFGDTFKQ